MARVRPSIARLALAFALGSVAASSALIFDVPGRGEFVVVTWLAGLVASFLAPGIAGFLAVLAGVAIWVALVDALDGTFQLLFLAIAIVVAITAHGALVGHVVRRIASVGITRVLGDRRVLAEGGIAVGIAALFVWFATELGANPP